MDISRGHTGSRLIIRWALAGVAFIDLPSGTTQQERKYTAYGEGEMLSSSCGCPLPRQTSFRPSCRAVNPRTCPGLQGSQVRSQEQETDLIA